ncbi:hypothetical protein BGZ94_010287 [Podila epigama]|nr:hypothetical protein BGZ94_010287 [Podila epigama]
MSTSGSWPDEINDRRKGAGYFPLQTGHPCFKPVDYIRYRSLTRQQSFALVDEWGRWMLDLKRSSCEAVRRAAVAASALTLQDIDEYYRERVYVDREQNALESSRDHLQVADQLHRARMERRLGEQDGLIESNIYVFPLLNWAYYLERNPSMSPPLKAARPAPAFLKLNCLRDLLLPIKPQAKPLPHS